MNQILDYNPMGEGGNNKGPSSVNTEKIIRVFALLLIFFAICLIVIGVLNRVKNSSSGQVAKKESDTTISIDQEGSTLNISVSSSVNLSKLIYNWNTNPEKTFSIDTGNKYTTTIDIPSGNNTLHLQVVDVDGNIKTETKEIASSDGVDIIDPTIEINSSNGKIEIIAKDETALDFITYRWDEDEEIKVEADEEEQTEIRKEIEANQEKSNLTVVAVDKANNTASKQQGFTIKAKPNIQVVLSEDRSRLIIKCSHNVGISRIEYTLNDRPYAAGEQELGGTPQEVQFEQPLDEGYNKIILNVTAVDGAVTTFGGECTYTPDQSGVHINDTAQTTENTTANQ